MTIASVEAFHAAMAAAGPDPVRREQARLAAFHHLSAHEGDPAQLPLLRAVSDWPDQPYVAALRRLAELAYLACDPDLGAQILGGLAQMAPDLGRPDAPRPGGWDVSAGADAATLAAALHDHGIVVARGAIPLEQAQWLAGFFIPISNQSSSQGSLAHTLAEGAGPNAFVPAAVVDALRPFCAAEPTLNRDVSIIRRMPCDAPEGGLPWHQDLVAFSQTALNLWIPLTPCGRDAPSVAFVARRVKEAVPTLARPDLPLAWPIPDAVVQDYAAGHEVIYPELALGDAMIFLSSTLHRTHITPEMTRTRYSLELRID